VKLFRLLLVAHVAHFCYSIQDRSNDSSTWYPNLSSALYDLDLWPTDPQSWSFHALVLWLRTSRANWHLNQFINFQPIVLTSLVTDEWMDGCRQNVMPLHASLVPPYLQSSTWPHLRDWDVMLVWRKGGEYWKKNYLFVTVLCTVIMVHKGTTSSYRSVDALYRALILLGLTLCPPSTSVSLVFMML